MQVQMGKVYKTLGGEDVRILCTDGEGDLPVIGLVGKWGDIEEWNISGKWNPFEREDYGHGDNSYDLMEVV